MSFQHLSSTSFIIPNTPKRPFSGELDLTRPTKRLNLQETPRSKRSIHSDVDMSDSEEETSRASAKAKGKGKVKYMRELPEIVWTRIFEQVYDSACTRWDRDYTLKDALAPLLIDKSTHPIALAVLYRHPHLSYDTLPIFARCAPLPARCFPGSKASIVRHLTIRASPSRTLSPPRYDPATASSNDYRSNDHTLPCFTIHPALKDVCSLFPDLNTFELVDTLILHSDDATVVFDALRSIKPRKARLEIRQWDLLASALGKDLLSASRPDIHGAFSNTPASSTPDDTPRPHDLGRNPSSFALQSAWKDALLNGGEVILPSWFIEPPPPTQNPQAHHGGIAAALQAFQQNMGAVPAAVPGSIAAPIVVGDSDDEDGDGDGNGDSSANTSGDSSVASGSTVQAGPSGGTSAQTSTQRPLRLIHLSTPQPGPSTVDATASTDPATPAAVGATDLDFQEPNRIFEAAIRSLEDVPSLSSDERRTFIREARNARGNAYEALEIADEEQQETSASDATQPGGDTTVVAKAGPSTASVNPVASSAVPDIDTTAGEGAANRRPAVVDQVSMPSVPRRTSPVNTANTGDTATETSRLRLRAFSSDPGSFGGTALGIPPNRPVTRSTLSASIRHAAHNRSYLLPSGNIRRAPSTAQVARQLATSPAGSLGSAASNIAAAAAAARSHASGINLVHARRMDHLYDSDEAMQAALLSSLTPALDQANNDSNTASAGSSSATVPMPRSTSRATVVPQPGNDVGIPTPLTVHATSYHLSQELRRMLGDLLEECWCPRIESFSFVALDPLASVIVRHPRVELWIRLPIPHIRIHLPRGISSLAVFKGTKELSRENARRRAAAAQAQDNAQPNEAEVEPEQVRIVAGDGEGGELIHPATRLFEIEVNTIAEMNDEREWIVNGDQLPSQLCRILVGTHHWRDVRIGPNVFSPSFRREGSEHPPSPSSSQFQSPTFSFMDDSDGDAISELSIDAVDVREGQGETYDRSAALAQKRRMEDRLAQMDEDEEGFGDEDDMA